MISILQQYGHAVCSRSATAQHRVRRHNVRFGISIEVGDRNRNWIIANCIGSRWKEFPRIGWILKENRNCAGMRRSTCDSGIAGRYIQLAVAVQVRAHESGVKVKWWDAAAAGSAAASTSSASAKGSDRHH